MIYIKYKILLKNKLTNRLLKEILLILIINLVRFKTILIRLHQY